MLMLNILQAIVNAGGRPLFVGGCVRDYVMGNEPKDWDIEVYGIGADKLISTLRQFGKVDVVGVSFGVIKLTTPDADYDFSLPRRENKSGKGHKGFIVEPDPNMTVREAASRRDFTINSMAMDPFTKEIFDEFDGQEDITLGQLNATSEAFKEDALRVLRGMQFAGRFELFAANNVLCEMCFEMREDYYDLANERVWGEWEKWALKSVRPSCGLDFLYDVGWLDLYPELFNLVACKQDPIWHPEGDVFTHTGHVVDAAMTIARRENLEGDDKLVCIFAALCHDMGKPSTTQIREVRGIQRWTSWGHEEAGVPFARSFLESIACPERIIERVLPLVQYHLAHVVPDLSRRYVRRLSLKLGKATLVELDRLIEADMSGRPPLPAGKHPASLKMLEIANSEPAPIAKSGVEPIIMGRHLIQLGMKPCKEMGLVLKELFEKQVEGEFEDLENGLKIASSLLTCYADKV